MKKAFFLILMLAFICSANQGFCAKDKKSHKSKNHVKHSKNHLFAEQIALLRYEIEALDNGTSKENVRKLKDWISKLEEKILCKMQQTQERLETYKNTLNETSETEDAEKISEKIHSSENKILASQELLNLLDQLKFKIKKH